MRYSKVYIDAIGYELPEERISTKSLEERLDSVYKALHIPLGQLELLTGIRERRYWPVEHTMHEHAAAAGKKALRASGIKPEDIGMLIYAGVCRDHLEPATACAVANTLGIPETAAIFDISNACLGVSNGIVQIANAIELGHIKVGLVVSCESCRQIIDTMIDEMNRIKTFKHFVLSIATLTGGSGAIAVILTHETVSNKGHKLIGGVCRNAVEHHNLCTWGPATGVPSNVKHIMQTDSIPLLKNGNLIGALTFNDLKNGLDWNSSLPQKIICHQVGAKNQEAILQALHFQPEQTFNTYPFLGNIGTVSLYITAAIAEETGFLQKKDRVVFAGIGSGLTCIMFGLEW